MNSTFVIENIVRNGFTETVITNAANKDFISVIPSMGARLNRAVLTVNGRQYSVLKELLRSKDLTRDEEFNNVKLFPFANRLKNGRYN